MAHRKRSRSDSVLSNGTLTLAGYGIALRVDRGHLEARDGAGRQRRTLRFPRVSPDLERIVVIGHSGTVSLDALQWMQDTGVTFVQIGSDAQLVAASAPKIRRHAELIRAQALAQVNGAALELSRELVAGKISGQQAVLKEIPDTEETRDLLGQLAEDCAEARSGSDLLTIEGKAANEYWSAWERVPVRFPERDRKRIPDRWLHFGSRGSPLSRNAQHAANPANAMLNYLYAVLRAETRLAIATLAMEPGLSIYHSTKRWRDSFSYDLMEPVRPMVDRWLLEFLDGRQFTRNDFFETRRGIVRVLPSVATALSETAPTWQEAIGPLAENAARELMAWADGGKRGALTRRSGNTSDGSILPTNLTSEYRKKGRPKEQRKRARSVRESWAANQQWEQENPDFETEIDYEEQVLANLEHVRLSEMQEATGLSLSYVAAIRNGREVPHRRHWTPLLELIQRKEDRIEREKSLEERWQGVDFEQDLRPGIEGFEIETIAKELGVSKSYAASIRRGAKVPALKHWEAVEQLVTSKP